MNRREFLKTSLIIPFFSDEDNERIVNTLIEKGSKPTTYIVLGVCHLVTNLICKKAREYEVTKLKNIYSSDNININYFETSRSLMVGYTSHLGKVDFDGTIKEADLWLQNLTKNIDLAQKDIKRLQDNGFSITYLENNGGILLQKENNDSQLFKLIEKDGRIVVNNKIFKPETRENS